MGFTLAINRERTPLAENRWLQSFIIIFIGVWIYSFVGTTDLANWVIENVLVVTFLSFITYTFKKHQFSDLSYLLICIFLCLHVYGSKFTYAANPFGFWLQDALDLPRNHYDRIVHFSFGFLLAYPMREMFLSWFKYPKWVSWLLPIEITLSFSALFELIEWAVADVFFQAHGIAYLGTQGDVWDAQKDIFLAVMGAIIATTIVSSIKKKFKIYVDGD